jgi:hydrogenase expression/formation protein HypE
MKNEQHIQIAHGGGGVLAWELLENLVFPALGGSGRGQNDAVPLPGMDNLLLTTDAFVVKPIFFRGGDIGSLSVHGTVNDLAVSGARPIALSMSLILEEGMPLDELRRILESAAKAARACGVSIITGDTKVVPRGEADKIFITTTGVGRRVASPDPARIVPGDCVLLSGGIAEHGMAVLSEREGLSFDTPILSDSAPVWPLVEALLEGEVEVHAMRDPTRGGLAACCHELARTCGSTFLLKEEDLPVAPSVQAACDMLGLDPLSVANEGKLVALLPADGARRALEILRGIPGGEKAAIIGAVQPWQMKPVLLETRIGGTRLVDLPYGEDLPRIC